MIMRIYHVFNLVTLIQGDTNHINILVPPLSIHDYCTNYMSTPSSIFNYRVLDHQYYQVSTYTIKHAFITTHVSIAELLQYVHRKSFFKIDFSHIPPSQLVTFIPQKIIIKYRIHSFTHDYISVSSCIFCTDIILIEVDDKICTVSDSKPRLVQTKNRIDYKLHIKFANM